LSPVFLSSPESDASLQDCLKRLFLSNRPSEAPFAADLVGAGEDGFVYTGFSVAAAAGLDIDLFCPF